MKKVAQDLVKSLLENGVSDVILINALCDKISSELGFDKGEFIDEVLKQSS